jgi:hypothetical protein
VIEQAGWSPRAERSTRTMQPATWSNTMADTRSRGPCGLYGFEPATLDRRGCRKSGHWCRGLLRRQGREPPSGADRMHPPFSIRAAKTAGPQRPDDLHATPDLSVVVPAVQRAGQRPPRLSTRTWRRCAAS